jgi:hypothetical protein
MRLRGGRKRRNRLKQKDFPNPARRRPPPALTPDHEIRRFRIFNLPVDDFPGP